jgi:hypothetical protein
VLTTRQNEAPVEPNKRGFWIIAAQQELHPPGLPANKLEIRFWEDVY